jgi:methylamine--corrinoid protein Co-methyltransferase
MTVPHILDILDRAHNGPVADMKDWSNKILPGKVREKLKTYRLQGTFDRSNPINTDDALADEFFKAGFELALETGLYCLDTERLIQVREDEIQEALRNAPTDLVLGKGRDAVLVKHRRPEDPYPPFFMAPMGNMVSEEIWIPLHVGILRHREVSMFQGCSLITMLGHSMLADSPYETLLGMYRARLTREVLWQAGRPGIPIFVMSGTSTPYGQLGSFGIPGGFDPEQGIPQILVEGELVTSFATLHKVIHAVNCGSKIIIGQQTLIGGSAGPPEGVVVLSIAGALLQFVVSQAHISKNGITDARYSGSCGREGQWAFSVQGQALSRNTPLILQHTISQRGGPCTEMLLYESAVGMLHMASSGVSINNGPRTSGVKHLDHISPLECKFCGEAFRASAGISRKKANEISRELTPKFEAMLWNPPAGKKFQDCYDLKTLEPTKEWLDLYLRVKRELIDLGLPLSSP